MFVFIESVQENFPNSAVDTDGLGTSGDQKSHNLGFPQHDFGREDSSFYSSSDDENSSDCADNETRDNEDEIGGAVGYIGSRRGFVLVLCYLRLLIIDSNQSTIETTLTIFYKASRLRVVYFFIMLISQLFLQGISSAMNVVFLHCALTGTF